jgi:hypothetical protein
MAGDSKMSMKLVEDEIKRSLATTEPEVICVRGHWGVGKTYAWNRFLEEARGQENGIGLKKYAYVSLFGLTSLEELKYAIFENTVSTTGPAEEPGFHSMQANVLEITKKFSKQKLLPVLQQLPIIKGYAGGVTPVLSFMMVKNLLICVDDIERRGEKLSMRDVLGLMSNLKIQKHSKICLILNDDAEDREKDQLDTYFEKVVDKSLHFLPSPGDCVKIALTAEGPTAELLREDCVTLGISNIRVLKRIEYFVGKIEPLLKEFDEGVLRQAIQTIALLGWCVYEPKNAPPIDFLRMRLANRYAVDRQDELPDNEAAWHALLDLYGFYELDEFDTVLLDGVKNGFFDPDAVKQRAKPLDERLKGDKSDSAVNDAWSLYHNSFADNEAAVADAIYQSTFDNVETVSPINLSGAVVLLKDLGRAEQAHKLIEQYMAKRNEPKEFYELEKNMFANEIKDHDVLKAFSEKLSTFQEKREPSVILLSIADRRGWSPEDIQNLTQISVDAYYDMFKAANGEEFAKLIEACLQFDRIGGLDEQTKQIPRLAKEALLRIGKESRLNARRVRKYGVKVPSPEAEETA